MKIEIWFLPLISFSFLKKDVWLVTQLCKLCDEYYNGHIVIIFIFEYSPSVHFPPSCISVINRNYAHWYPVSYDGRAVQT